MSDTTRETEEARTLAETLEKFDVNRARGSRDAIVDFVYGWGHLNDRWRFAGFDDRVSYKIVYDQTLRDSVVAETSIKVQLAFLTNMLENELPTALSRIEADSKNPIEFILRGQISKEEILEKLNIVYDRKTLVLHAFFPIRPAWWTGGDDKVTSSDVPDLGPGYLFHVLTKPLALEVDKDYEILRTNPELSNEDYFEKLIRMLPYTHEVFVVIYGLQAYGKTEEAIEVCDMLWRVKTRLYQKDRLLGENKKLDEAKRLEREENKRIIGPKLRVLIAGPGAEDVEHWIEKKYGTPAYHTV